MDTDVVVVGAGPTGLALACGLRAAGVGVRVLDQADGPAVTSRALGLQPRGVEVLDRLGALGDLPDRALPVREVIITVEGRELARLQVGLSMERLGGRPGLIMSQAEIEGALRERLSALGGSVEWGRQVTGLEQESTGVTVSLEDGTSVDAGWVVGADGAHSIVRKAMGVGFPGVPLVESFLLADVHAALERPRNAASVWMRGNRLLAAFPLPGQDLWRVMAPSPFAGAGSSCRGGDRRLPGHSARRRGGRRDQLRRVDIGVPHPPQAGRYTIAAAGCCSQAMPRTSTVRWAARA